MHIVISANYLIPGCRESLQQQKKSLTGQPRISILNWSGLLAMVVMFIYK